MAESLYRMIIDQPAESFDAETPLPSARQVRAWWDDYGMLENIRAHSEMVCKVALLVADWLIEAGLSVNRPAVEAGALAHDLAKTPCLGTERLHAQEGEEILAGLGYPQLGQLVGRHVVIPASQPLDETMLVNYADKRVKHDEIVDLHERFDYIEQRYGKDDPDRILRIKAGRERAFEVEQTIFGAMGGKHRPEDIGAILGQGSLQNDK